MKAGVNIQKNPVGLRCRVGEYVGGSWLQLPWSVRSGVGEDRGWGGGSATGYKCWSGNDLGWVQLSYRCRMGEDTGWFPYRIEQ